ncbi:MAG: hypothetical protein ACK42D_00540 [Candidatus Paceibacteria bacterium]
MKSSTAIYASMRYLSWDVIRSGKVPLIKVLRHVVYEFSLSRQIIEVAVYQAFDVVNNKYYPLAESVEEASVSVLLAGALKS